MSTRGHDSGRHRPRLTILLKLILAFAVPTMALFALFAFVAHEVQRSDLEAELGRRLEGIASSASTRIRGQYLVDLQPGHEEDRRYASAYKRLKEVAEATGVVRIYVFDRDFRSRVDTEASPVGTAYFQAELDRTELEQVFAGGAPKSSVLFQGVDGRTYKAGYAPVYASEEDRTVVLALGVDAPADFFDRLADLRRSLILYGALLAVAVTVIALFVAARITRPVRSLVAAAERIGAGDLAEPIERTSHDELGFLAETMEQMRQDLGARDERMQLMLSGIAHEVRNPLGGIELFSGILRDDLKDDPDSTAHVVRIEREIDYLKRVVNSFLEYARRPKPEFGVVKLADLATEVVELEDMDASAAGVSLTSQVAPVSCRGDAGQLKRVLLNLVRNAIQAAGQGDDGEVRLIVTERDGSPEICVVNTGAPISAEVAERLFEPFFTTREKGTGLGLAFVKEIVADHGGTIEVESSADEGTQFHIRLQPIATSSEGRDS